MFTPLDLNNNFKVDIAGKVLTVKHLPAYKQMELIHNTSMWFERLQEVAQLKSFQEFRYYVIYKRCILSVWELLKRSAPLWSRWRVKKAFLKKANQDIVFFFDLLNEIYNFWLWLGKWIALLTAGRTLQMALGKGSTGYFMRKDLGLEKSENYLLRKFT